jgi:lipid-binding SYLF domain-containing protein
MRAHLVSTAAALALVACAGSPDTRSEKLQLQREASTTLQMMKNKDPSLRPLLETAAGYAVFPDIGKGGFIAGAAHGQGVLYEGGQPTGYVTLSQGSFGAQIGAQTFAELIVLRSSFDVERLKSGTFSLGANASAVALNAGVAAATAMNSGTPVFVVARGGVMAELSLSGQRIRYSRGGGG